MAWAAVKIPAGTVASDLTDFPLRLRLTPELVGKRWLSTYRNNRANAYDGGWNRLPVDEWARGWNDGSIKYVDLYVLVDVLAAQDTVVILDSDGEYTYELGQWGREDVWVNYEVVLPGAGRFTQDHSPNRNDLTDAVTGGTRTKNSLSSDCTVQFIPLGNQFRGPAYQNGFGIARADLNNRYMQGIGSQADNAGTHHWMAGYYDFLASPPVEDLNVTNVPVEPDQWVSSVGGGGGNIGLWINGQFITDQPPAAFGHILHSRYLYLNAGVGMVLVTTNHPDADWITAQYENLFDEHFLQRAELPTPPNAVAEVTVSPHNAGQVNVPDNLGLFPLRVDLADMPVGFWGTVTPDGGDVRTIPPYSREIVEIDTVAETGTMVVQVDLDASRDTKFWVTVDGTSTEPNWNDQQGPSELWDTSRVWHFTDPNNLSDAEGVVTFSGVTPTAVPAPLGSGVQMAASDYLTAQASGYIHGGTGFILMELSTLSSDSVVLGYSNGYFYTDANGHLVFEYLMESGATQMMLRSLAPVNDGNWHQVVLNSTFVDAPLTNTGEVNLHAYPPGTPMPGPTWGGQWQLWVDGELQDAVMWKGDGDPDLYWGRLTLGSTYYPPSSYPCATWTAWAELSVGELWLWIQRDLLDSPDLYPVALYRNAFAYSDMVTVTTP